MAGRKRLPIGTFGEITVQKLAVRKYRASTRYRDWDGVTRQVSWTAESRASATWALKKELTGEHRHQVDRLVTMIVEYAEANMARLREEAALENRARRLHGKPGAPWDWIVVELAVHEVISRASTTRLNVDDVRRARRAARCRIGFATDESIGSGVPRLLMERRL